MIKLGSIEKLSDREFTVTWKCKTIFLNIYSLGDAMNISEDQKRWLVIGIAFNKLVPHIRPFVEQSLQAEYQSLKSSHNIHIQTPPGILKNHPKHLKYENINSNSSHKLSPFKFDFSKFDYKVSSHVDFAKLYLQPFMAKFSAFDGKCDGSAVLSLLVEVPVFSNATQFSAKAVREDVRNEWAHCNFTDWDAVKFQGCFHEMRKLVHSFALPTADETTLLSELNDWETKGMFLNYVTLNVYYSIRERTGKPLLFGRRPNRGIEISCFDPKLQ